MAAKVATRHTLSSQLVEIIESRGLTAYAVAQLAEVDPGVVSRWMNGRRDIRMETADKLAAVLGLRLTETPGARSAARPTGRPARTPPKSGRPSPPGRVVADDIGRSADHRASAENLRKPEAETPPVDLPPAPGTLTKSHIETPPGGDLYTVVNLSKLDISPEPADVGLLSNAVIEPAIAEPSDAPIVGRSAEVTMMANDGISDPMLEPGLLVNVSLGATPTDVHDQAPENNDNPSLAEGLGADQCTNPTFRNVKVAAVFSEPSASATPAVAMLVNASIPATPTDPADVAPMLSNVVVGDRPASPVKALPLLSNAMVGDPPTDPVVVVPMAEPPTPRNPFLALFGGSRRD